MKIVNQVDMIHPVSENVEAQIVDDLKITRAAAVGVVHVDGGHKDRQDKTKIGNRSSQRAGRGYTQVRRRFGRGIVSEEGEDDEPDRLWGDISRPKERV